ncbi:hypothetical protein [Moorena sp. SIO3H5]|nr:hypothetical protein [Moorena sp. SIO3H5]
MIQNLTLGFTPYVSCQLSAVSCQPSAVFYQNFLKCENPRALAGG